MATKTSAITAAEFKAALERYPALIKSMTKEPKPDTLNLEQLDKFRYVEAPASFSKNTGRSMELKDVQKLVDWKLRHGKFRPTLPKLVASNSDEKIAEATKEAFSYYASNPTDIANTIKKLADPLKGIGPATASLLLAVHDPKNVIFFSDEAYRWLCVDGEKASPKYNVAEFEDLFKKSKALMTKLSATPIEVEQVAYVLIKESEPVYEPKPKKEASGRPRGRPAKPDSEKKAKKPTVPGRGRGRPPKDPNGVAPKAEKTEGTKKRGRPSKAAAEAGEEEETKEDVKTPAANKRKADDEETPASGRRSGKKAKA